MTQMKTPVSFQAGVAEPLDSPEPWVWLPGVTR